MSENQSRKDFRMIGLCNLDADILLNIFREFNRIGVSTKMKRIEVILTDMKSEFCAISI